MFERTAPTGGRMKIGLLVTALFPIAALSTLKAQGDIVPPQLTALSFAATTLDTSSAPATLTVNFSATDDLSGVTYAAITFASPAGKLEQGGSVNFKPANGIASFLTVTFPRYSPAGTWTVNFLQLSDAAGNFVSMSASDLASAGFPTQVVVDSDSDTVPPKLTALTLSPTTLDTTNGPANLTITFKARDDLSGVALASAAFVSPNGKVFQVGNLDIAPAVSASGSFTIAFPRYSQPGTWTVSYLALTDAAGNSRSLTAHALADADMPTAITLNSVSDSNPPKLTALSFAPALIDTNSGTATVVANFSATDDLSGVAFAAVGFMAPEGNAGHAGTVTIAPCVAASGFIAVVFPQYAATGLWTVSYLTLTDAAGNSVTLRAAALQALGFPTQITVGTSANKIRIRSSVSGLAFAADGKSYTTPKTFVWPAGSSHTVVFASPIAEGPGSRYVFAGWADGTASNPRTIVAPDSGTIYTANFDTQYLLQETADASQGTLRNTPASTDGYYNSGTEVQVEALPASGYEFTHFTGDLKGKTNPRTITIGGAESIAAHFKPE